MQKVTVVAPRLHVVAAVLETEAGLPVCLRCFFLCPSKESKFGAHDCVVYDAAGFLCDLRSEDT